MSLDGKVAFISASTKGIGRAIAEKLASQGAHVHINGRSAERVQQVVEAVQKSGGKASGIVADLSSAEGVATVVNQLPTVDILVNNLGIFGDTISFWDISDELFEECFQANIMTGVRLCRHYLKKMIEKNDGRVIFVSSVFAKEPTMTELLPLAISDAGKMVMAKSLAQLTKNTKVTVNSLILGNIASDGFKEFFPKMRPGEEPTEEALNKFVREDFPQVLIGRIIQPSEVAGLAAYLCGDDAGAINGAAIDFEGGWLRGF